MELKVCSKCHQSFPATTEFFRHDAANRDGLRSWCKPCNLACDRAYRIAHQDKKAACDHAYYLAHKEEKVAYAHTYLDAHRDEVRAESHVYRAAHKKDKAAYDCTYYMAHKEQVAVRAHAYYRSHREQIAAYEHRRFKANPMLRLSRAISVEMRNALHGHKAGGHWESLVGYTLADLTRHLESKFQPGMSWNNYGRHGWVIDHIRPQVSFHFTFPDDSQFKECWALENLQPLWWRDNLQKHAKEPALLATDQRVRRRRGR